MNTLTKDELVTQLATKMALPASQAHQAVNHVLEIIQTAVLNDRKVELRGFGSFVPKTRAGRVGRNPRDPENKPIQIPPKKTVKFKLSVALKKELNKTEGAPAPAPEPPAAA